jgi:hypothetical protein
MRTHTNTEAPFVIDGAAILPRLEAIMCAIDAALGPGTARQHPNLVAACILYGLVDQIASAIRDARIGE